METKTPAARLHSMKTSSFTYRTFTWQRAGNRWGKWLYIALWTMGTKVYPLALFFFFGFNCREGRRSACSLTEGKKPQPFLITLAWRHLFFHFLHLLLEKLRHNSTHYIHSEDEKEHTCPLLLWKSIQPFITGCNSTHLIQKHILTLLLYMKGHHGSPINSIASLIFLSMKCLLREEKNTIEKATVT